MDDTERKLITEAITDYPKMANQNTQVDPRHLAKVVALCARLCQELDKQNTALRTEMTATKRYLTELTTKFTELEKKNSKLSSLLGQVRSRSRSVSSAVSHASSSYGDYRRGRGYHRGRGRGHYARGGAPRGGHNRHRSRSAGSKKSGKNKKTDKYFDASIAKEYNEKVKDYKEKRKLSSERWKAMDPKAREIYKLESRAQLQAMKEDKLKAMINSVKQRADVEA
jgi:uncharacterized coiled-coil protein SlyX